MTPPSVAERNRADRGRRSFSVLCWRGWCDYEFKIRDIAAMVGWVAGRDVPLPTHLPRRECPSPQTCQCVCHDEARETPVPETGGSR